MKKVYNEASVWLKNRRCTGLNVLTNYNRAMELLNLKLIQPVKNKFKKNPLISGVCLLSFLAIFYWGLVASDIYVVETHVIIQSTEMANMQSMELTSLLGGINSGGGTDQLLLRDHLLSVDMLKKIDKKLNLREHYSDLKRDFISRMWDKDISIELFYKYYLTRVNIQFEDSAGILIIKSEAFDPETAHAISTMLLESGELFMNSIVRDLAKVQVEFLEKAVLKMSDNVVFARQTMLDFQNNNGLVSPENATENLVVIINSMQSRLSELQASRAAMLSYLVPRSPNIVEINMQIAAVKKQIKLEKSRLTSPIGKTLNKVVEEYQRLQMNAEFAQDVYKSALVSLERGRIDAARTLKKMTILQSPIRPEYPLKPERIYNIIVFIVVTLLISGILSLLIAIIADHKD